ncbi:unnamed protein product, partial [Adineta steineri]
IHKKGYQEIDTSIISSIILKVKGLGFRQTDDNHTLVIDGADYIVPPQENNALFLMTNFIRTDQQEKRCEEYSFTRLDWDKSDKEQSYAHGFNFRFASHWKHQNRSYRTLTKAYGLRFIISVSGYAGRFDLMTLALNIGSLVGILGLVKFICDCVAFYVHPQ